MNAKTYVWIILLALLLASLYIVASIRHAPGFLAAPLDDAYIHFQYARQINNGSPWQYNAGDAPSSGATSMLYPFILATGLLLGIADENLIWYAIALGVVALILSAALTLLITRQLLDIAGSRSENMYRFTFVLAALLFLLSGAVQWGYFNGMETGLFTLLLLTTFYAFIAKRFFLASATVFLSSLTRPEGLIMAAVFWLIMLIDWWRGEDRRARLNSLVAPTTALFLSLLPIFVNYMLTGSAMATGALAKSWFQNVPFRFTDILVSIGRDFTRILQRLSIGFLANPTWPLIPLLLPTTILGWGVLWHRKIYSVVGLTFGWFLAGTLSSATLITAIWQQGRYQIPIVALLLPIAVIGGVSLLDRLPDRIGKLAQVTTLVAFVMLSIWQTGESVDSYAKSVYSTVNQQIAIAEWINDNLPEQSWVAVHDAGAIRYIGNRPTFDMIGLTSQGVAAAWRNGMGAVFERMENAEDRPTHFATYPDAFSIPYLKETDLFSKELYRVDLPDYSKLSAAGPTQAVYIADWRLANSGKTMMQNDMNIATQRMKLVDSIDMADLEDEQRHSLYWWEGAVVPGFPTEVRQFRYHTEPLSTVLDGGRLLTGGMVFEAAVIPGMDLFMIGRFHAQDSVTVDVYVDDEYVGNWRYPAIPGEWLETAFPIPAENINSNPLKIELALPEQNTPGTKFEPYYIWLWQGANNEVRQEFQHQTNTHFEGDLELVGYDLDSNHYKPGENVPLVLYWRSPEKNDVDAAVFVHLYDEHGDLVVQLDQRPYLGTRPPYSWSPNELVIDPQTLKLPSSLPEGQYQLVVGLYDPSTLIRVEIDESDHRILPEDRLLIQTIWVDGG